MTLAIIIPIYIQKKLQERFISVVDSVIRYIICLLFLGVKMSWSKEQIRSLRLRMGWEHSDLARRLNCSTQMILEIEHGVVEIDGLLLSNLQVLSAQAESNAIELKNAPLAEFFLEDSHVSQVSLSELNDK